MSQNPEATKGCGVLFLVCLWFGIGGAVPFSWAWYIVLSLVVLAITYFIWRRYSSDISPEAPQPFQITGGVLTVMLVIVLLARACGGCSDSKIDDRLCSDIELKLHSIEAVKSFLTYPNTADFCSTYDMTVDKVHSNEWVISGYVDSKNVYNLEIRNSWSVRMKCTETGGHIVIDVMTSGR